jgi:rhomboid-like protein
MRNTTPVVLNLIIINVLVYLAQHQFSSPFNLTNWGALHYFQSTDFQPHQFLTNMFMHDTSGLAHILFNMFGLWMFGSILENRFGSKRFLFFYMVCGLGAGILTQLTVPYSAEVFSKSEAGISAAMKNNLPAAAIVDIYKQQFSAIGASGAIMGIMAAFAYLYPNAEMYVMLIPIPVKAKYVIPVMVLIDLFGGLQQIPGSNIAHFAHLGGAIVGFLLVLYWKKKEGPLYH